MKTQNKTSKTEQLEAQRAETLDRMEAYMAYANRTENNVAAIETYLHTIALGIKFLVDKSK